MSKKTRKFKTEVQQLLDLVIHSLYSKKEIFLRELISNSSDAIDRLRFESLTDKSLLEGDEDWKIKIAVDADARTLTISDNGIGMTSEELDRNLGTIANSGTRNFLEALKEGKAAADLEMIGQFGVGFYASFMVADSVTVVTRHAGSGAEALCWVSKGDGSYSVQEAEREQRGTDVTLHLREDVTDLLSEWRIREVVKQYSDYIAYPVTMDVEREEKGEEGEEPTKTITEETLNSMKAIWKKAKADVTDEEYKEFYHHVSHDFGEPLRVVHYAAEGATEFKSLMFIPANAPFDMYMREHQKGVQLYVRNVFITDDCKDLLPDYLRFVCGVVDSSDLPLNVSREMLQDAAVIRRISKSLVSKLLGELKDMQEKEAEAYRNFYAQFGRVFKEGVHQDFENHDKLKELVLFRSTKSEEVPISLHDYVERMPSSQKEIYFITADSQEAAASSPHLEAFAARDYEVLFMVDPIDEWVVQRLTEYDGKKLKAVDRGDVELDDAETKEATEKKLKEAGEQYSELMTAIQKHLDEDIKEVRLSKRLTGSVCCLVADDAGMNANMERIMRAMNQEVPKSKRILEVNPEHPLVDKMNGLQSSEEPAAGRLTDYIDLVYNQALLAEGSQVKDTQRFTQLVTDLMVQGV